MITCFELLIVLMPKILLTIIKLLDFNKDRNNDI
jgi:hypothetical protein